MKNLKLNISIKKAKLNSKLTVEKLILIFLSLLLIGLKILHTYKVYHLVDEWFHLLNIATGIDLKITNVSYFSEIMITTYESKIRILKNDNRLLKSIISICRNFPSIVLYSFVLLSIYCYLIIPNFNLLKYLLIGLVDYLIHFLVHKMHDDKKRDWKKCKGFLCYFFNFFKTDGDGR